LQHTTATEFWWDLTLDHNTTITTVLSQPPTLEGRECAFEWDLGWAEGVTYKWNGGGSATWTAWTWESKSDSGTLIQYLDILHFTVKLLACIN